MEGTPLAILLSKEMSSMFCSLLPYLACMLLVVQMYLEYLLSDGLDENLYEPG